MAKQTITIRKYGDTVYFLSSDGFQKGTVKTTLVTSSKYREIEITYRVVTKTDSEEFGGYEKRPSELFDSQKEMIAFYQEVSL